LANGTSITRRRALDPVKATNGLDAFAKVVLTLYADRQSTGLVIFQGVVTSVNRLAAKNPSGSYTGVVLNCSAPPILMGTFSASNYKYWGTTYGSSSKNEDLTGPPTSLGEKLGMEVFTHLGTSREGEFSVAEDCVEYILQAAGAVLERASNDRYDSDAVLVHFERRGRKIVPSDPISNLAGDTDALLCQAVTNAFRRGNPLNAVGLVARTQLLMSMVPLMSGQMDIFPAFPWDSDHIATIKPGSLLKLRNTTALSAMADNIDGVLVPLIGLMGEVALYPPNEDLPASGVVRTMQLPQWLSPFLHNQDSEEKDDNIRKTNKAAKRAKADRDADDEKFDSLADMMAKAFFTEIKNGGVTVNLGVPWYRLEFLDALGYVIKIEHPYIADVGQTDDLYGMINSGTFRVQSTPGGSRATLELTLTHVRSAEAQDSLALSEHPMYNISGGPKSSLKSVAGQDFKVMTRSQQQSLEGGNQSGYPSEAISNARNKK